MFLDPRGGPARCPRPALAEKWWQFFPPPYRVVRFIRVFIAAPKVPPARPAEWSAMRPCETVRSPFQFKQL